MLSLLFPTLCLLLQVALSYFLSRAHITHVVLREIIVVTRGVDTPSTRHGHLITLQKMPTDRPTWPDIIVNC
jgi:hypothetical protein